MATVSPTGNHRDYLDKRRVTVVGAVVNVVLAAAKVLFGVLGHSQALIADGIHSLSDLASDGLVLVAAKFGSEEADAEHPYGHARFETAATIGLGLLLLGVALGITINAAERIMNPATLMQPGLLALAAAVASILSKEWLYQYTVRVADKLRSPMLRANGWHHRTDAISSVIVLVGIFGTMAGLPYLDAVAAIGVGLIIARIGWRLGWEGVLELVDTGADRGTRQAIEDSILGIEGVKAFHTLRTRSMGEDILVEAHVLVRPDITVSEGHMIADRVRGTLLSQHRNVSDVLVHIDPEDDAQDRPSSGLPDRAELLEVLRDDWRALNLQDSVDKVNLHYLGGSVAVEVVLPLSAARDRDEATRLARELKTRISRRPRIGKVDVYFH